MRVNDIFTNLKEARGSNLKKSILEQNKDNENLKKALRYGLDPFTPFNIVKVPKVTSRLNALLNESDAWKEFFRVADRCSQRKVTGNAAINEVHQCFSSVNEEDEKWMRKILKKHLSIGVSTKTANKVFPGLEPTFEVSLAQKFEEKRIQGRRICVEPKLDGIRCVSIVRNGKVSLYARSGKQIINFDNTIGKELETLPDGVYDGEIMGKDFTALMRQAYRKEQVDVSDTYMGIFDFLSLEEWDSKDSTMTCEERYVNLMHYVMPERYKFLKVVERIYCMSNYEFIKHHHDNFVDLGFEGVMIKDLDAPYKFGRGHEVMKFKSFHDVDLEIKKLLEGTGRHAGKLGSVIVNFEGVDVQVGSGFSDELRELVWQNPDDFIGRVIEVRYQEVTPDGSLRFPTFVCFRNDK